MTPKENDMRDNLHEDEHTPFPDENEELLKKVGAYVDGELAAVERDAGEHGRREQPRIRDAAHAYRWLDDVARATPKPRLSDDQLERIWSEIETRKEEPEITRAAQSPAGILRPRLVRAAAAAAAVVLVTLAAYLASGVTSSVEEPEHDDNFAEHVEGEKPKVHDEGGVIYDDF